MAFIIQFFFNVNMSSELNLVQRGEACKIVGVDRANDLNFKHKINASEVNFSYNTFSVPKNRKDHIRSYCSYAS